MAITSSPRKPTLFEGILLVILGILAIVIPQFFSRGIEVVIGVLLILSGLVMGFRAFGGRGLPEAVLLVVLAVIAIIAGIFLLAYPWQGLLAITVILAIYFLIEGISKLFLAAKLRHSTFFTWYLLSGLISIALAIIVWAGWPYSSYWLLGLLVGINLIFFGIARIALALSLR